MFRLAQAALRTRPLFALGSTAATGVFGFAAFQLACDAKPQSTVATPVNGSTSESPALNAAEFRNFVLQEKRSISHNTSLLRFQLKDGAELGLPVASCIVTRAQIGDKTIIRPYTPTSDTETKGHFDLLVKRYENGVMSKHLTDMNPGDTIEIKGPILKLDYKQNMKSHIGMIAGGTGIAPMYQIIKKILKNPQDRTKISLVFANVSEKDILLKDELDALAKAHPNFQVHYVLDKAPEQWTGSAGYVTETIAKTYLPSSNLGENVLILVCGPPPMMAHVSGEKTKDFKQGDLSGILRSLEYNASQVFKF